MRKRVICFFAMIVLCLMGTVGVFAVGATYNLGNCKNSTYAGSETGDRVNVSAYGTMTKSRTITTHYSKMANQQPLFCYAGVFEYHYETITGSSVNYGRTAAAASKVTDEITRHPSSSAYSYYHKGQCYSSNSDNLTYAMSAPLIDELIFWVTQ